MATQFWITLGFSTLTWAILWSVGRWVLPRFRTGDSGLEVRETELQRQIADLEKRLAESERKNQDLDRNLRLALQEIADLNGKQEFLLGQYQKVSTRASELERQVDALKRGEPPAEDTLPVLIVAIGADAALKLDMAALRAVRTETGMEIQRIDDATLDKLRQTINRARMAGRRFNVHMAVHSGPKGVELGGQLIDPIALSEIFEGAHVLLIAGCESSQVGDFLGVVPYVVTMAEEVTHENASLFTRAFWTAIGKRMTPGPALRDALNRAPSGMSEYVTRHF